MNNDTIISEHAWSQEQIVAYIAGGLSAAENERLEAHAHGCQECSSALEKYRRLDRGMNSLFGFENPGPELEDRLLFSLRMGPERKPAREGWQKRLLIAATAAAVMTTGGIAASYMNKLPTPENIHGWSFAKGKLDPATLYSEREGVIRDQRLPPGVTFLTNEGLGRTQSTDFDGDGVLPAMSDGSVKGVLRQSNADTTLKELDPIRARNSVLEDRTVNTLGLGTDLDGRQWSDKAPDGSSNTFGYYPPQSAENGRETTRYNNTFGRAYRNQPGVPTNYYGDMYEAPVTGKPAASEGKPTESAKGKEAAWYFQPSDHKPSEQDKKLLLNYSLGLGAGTGSREGEKLSESTTQLSVPTATSPEKKEINLLAPIPPALPSSPQVPPQSTGPKPGTTEVQPEPKKNPDQVPRTVIIRSGEIEFEVDSFDSSAAIVTKLVAGIKGAFVATTNSEKLVNGKVKGSITVRVPPEQLDGLLLDLRRELGKTGELRGSRIGSQDITKQYVDLESRLKAAKAMEERLLQIIKEGKGDIKVLLEAEKELGVWRTRIEEFEGELRYYANLVALSTLTITLTEKEIKASATMTESERVQAGVEVEEVDKAFQQLMAAVVEAKGRVTKSDMKQLSAGQFNATLNFEVAPEAAGVLRDRLRQLGKVARLEIDRVQSPEGTLTKNAKIQRGDTMFLVQLYNLANMAPREVAVVQLAVLDVPAAYRTLREAAAKTTGRVMAAQLNEQDQQNVSAHFDFEVRRTDEPVLRSAVDSLGEIVTRQVSRTPESENVTDAKVLYRTTIIAANQLKPRERVVLALEVAEVEQTAEFFRIQANDVQANDVKGRQIDSQFAKDRSGKLTAKLIFEVPLAAADRLVESFKRAGAVSVFQKTRDPQIPEGKYATARLEVTLANGEQIVGPDDRVWPKVQQGLSYSVRVLLTSVTWLVFGLCVVLPWAVIGYFGFGLLKLLFRSKQPAVSPTTPTPTVTAS